VTNLFCHYLTFDRDLISQSKDPFVKYWKLHEYEIKLMKQTYAIHYFIEKRLMEVKLKTVKSDVKMRHFYTKWWCL